MGAATSTASKDRQERQNNSNKKQANEIKEVVKKKLGLKTTVPGPMDYLQDEKKTLAYNLEGKDKFMYGAEASEETNKEMVKRGLLSYNKDTGGYSNVVDGKIISNANTIKYGSSNSAMGSGDPTGVMTSIPISKEMLEQQNKIKGISTAALSFAMPGIGGSVMRLSAGKNLADVAQPQAAYNDYMKSFSAKQSGKKFTSDRTILGLLGLKQGNKTKKDTLGQ
tara:strand:- start:455 stop:1123 length:669 start_codon:yes stop_codon:yes gene_type:complete